MSLISKPRWRSFAPRSFKEKTKKQIAIFVTIAIFFLIIVFPFLPHLIVVDGETNRILYKTTFTSQDIFVIKFIHSIHLTPVYEYYQISDSMDIILTEVHFDTYSVGMPSDLNKGEVLELKDGEIIIKNMQRILPYIDLRVGQVIADHRLIIGDKEIRLADIASPGSWIRFKASNLSILDLLGRGY